MKHVKVKCLVVLALLSAVTLSARPGKALPMSVAVGTRVDTDFECAVLLPAQL